MHPLVLHFPLVLVFLSAIWEFFFSSKRQDNLFISIGDGLMLITAFCTMITAIMGMLLSREPGYDADAIWVHKCGGVTISLLVLGWYSSRNYIRQQNYRLLTAGAVTVLTLIVTGHEGASITHGENFLLAPVTKEVTRPKVNIEDAKLYADVIQPILDAKCLSCHNSKKAKGDLIMETAAAFFKGGKNGKLWDTTASDLGLLLSRIHLPLDDKKHMPPKGKLQLTPEEATILALWLRSGADTTVRLMALNPSDSIRVLAASQFSASSDEAYSFPPASDGMIRSLNNFYRLVAPVAAESPALQVSYFGAFQFKGEAIEELLPVKQQVISILLNKMPVVDNDMKVIAQFKELRDLNLSFTKVSDSGINALLSLPNLKHLSVSGTRVTASGLKRVAAIKSLKQLYCWSTDVSDEDLVSIRKEFPLLNIENGFTGDSITIQLNPPIIDNEESIIEGSVPLRIKHFVKGVEIRYTIDGKEPDSIDALIYDSKVQVSDAVTIKARAFKKGWISSETSSRLFYKKGFAPDSMRLSNAPDSAYRGKGAQTLFDGIKGDNNFRSGLWLGFRQKPMDLEVYFNAPRQVSSVMVSGLVDIGGYLMPPEQIQVWGGNAGESLRLLSMLKPKQPSKDSSAYQASYVVNFNPVRLTHIRLLIKPVNALPKWHNGKGEKGWLFTDEIFIR
ncbi:DUF2231 domain-containing protein [Flavihumibacter fluvii]|uniref:DUF2231 domain-containing protein n=1 Tax=Flavihumibacter fluvii TaxID=2838157 RepID=UPI00336AE427